MSDDRPRGALRRVGALWKPKPGAKSLGSGSITVNGLRQRFVILKNDRKKDGSSEPDYALMSGDEPEVDDYARRSASSNPSTAASAPARRVTRATPERFEAAADDSIPF